MSTFGRALIGFRQGAWGAFIARTNPSTAPYGTHVPVLMAAIALIKPKRILELGSGFYSTPLFLDKRYCPSVTQLTSIETDASWFEHVRSVLGEDQRWDSRLIQTSVAEWLRRGEAGFRRMCWAWF